MAIRGFRPRFHPDLSLTGGGENRTDDTAKSSPEQRALGGLPSRPWWRAHSGGQSFSERPPLMELIEKWKIHDAVETYGIRHWGKGYFGINKAGHVTVHPTKRSDQAIDLKE